MAAAEGVYNAVSVRGSAVGDVMFYGRGAGDLPTASAVMGDVLDALAHRAKRRDLGWSEDAPLIDQERDLPLYWYMRGEIARPEGSEQLAEGAYIVGPLSVQAAKELAERSGAAALMPVLR